MSDLILDSLEIKNFRLFKHLEIERLGRVNLIVGKNGVGKTVLLEAIRLYAYRALPTELVDMLRSRNEVSFERARSKVKSNGEDWYLALRHLFHGRPDLFKESSALSIGPMRANDGRSSLEMRFEPGRTGFGDAPHIVAEMGESVYAWPLQSRDYRWAVLGLNEVICLFVSAYGLEDNRVAALWDDIVLTDLEKIVLESLRIILPEVQRLNFILSEPQRIPVVKAQSLPFLVTLRSLGEGMTRLLGIALALVNTKDGLLLIDEIEGGLHYSVQPVMWRLVFETAARLNVQVFATTHSWDCIESFQEAAEAHPEEGVLISLRKKQHEEEGIAAVLFDEGDLRSVTRSYIEVR